MFESELLNAIFAGIVAILLPGLLAIKFLSWLSEPPKKAAKNASMQKAPLMKRETINDRIIKRSNTCLKN